MPGEQPKPVRLINLTGQDLSVRLVPDGVLPLPITPGITAVIVPVEHEQALTTTGASVWLGTVRRGRAVPTLPPTQPDVRYVVAAEVAAVSDRTDLVFPVPSNAVTDSGSSAGSPAVRLGHFTPRRIVRHWRRLATWRWRRLSARSIGSRDWVIGALFAIGTALSGAALGVVPDLASDGWADSPGRLGALGALTAAAALFLVVGVRGWKHRNAVRRAHGSAYVIEEIAAGWTYEEKDAFLATLRAEFAATWRVAGPTHLDQGWDWSTQRAQDWDAHLDQLVRAFWATYFNDDHNTNNAVFIWARWPVAVAFGWRATRRRRGVVLQVRQRPSYGRAGTVEAAAFHRPAHTFLPGPPPGRVAGTISTHRWNATLVSDTPANDPTAGVPDRSAVADQTVVILVLRVGGNVFGPLPRGGSPEPTAPLPWPVRDGANLGLSATQPATVLEWRHLPPEGSIVDWDQYPALVANATQWICDQAAAHPAAMLLLTASVPQEIAIGLGIHAATRGGWPAVLWPLQFDRPNAPFVTVNLNLGLNAAPRT